MTQKKDAVGNNPLSHLIPRGPAPRPQVTTPPVQAQPAPTPNSTPTPNSYKPPASFIAMAKQDANRLANPNATITQ